MEAYIQQNALLVYAIVMIAAALLHWGQKVRKGEATADFMAYWFTETPGYSLGTFGALAGGLWLIYTTNGLANMAAHMVVEGAFATGWMINSAVSPGSAPANAVAAAGSKVAGFIRLSLLPWLIAAALVGMLMGGCAVIEGLTQPLHKQPTAEQEAAETPVQKAMRLAHATIDEANAALLSLNKVIGDNIDNAVWTKSQAQSYLDQSVKFGKRLDQAREAMRLGDLTDAQSQAEAVRMLIITLQRKAAEAARTSLLDVWPQYI